MAADIVLWGDILECGTRAFLMTLHMEVSQKWCYPKVTMGFNTKVVSMTSMIWVELFLLASGFVHHLHYISFQDGLHVLLDSQSFGLIRLVHPLSHGNDRPKNQMRQWWFQSLGSATEEKGQFGGLYRSKSQTLGRSSKFYIVLPAARLIFWGNPGISPIPGVKPMISYDFFMVHAGEGTRRPDCAYCHPLRRRADYLLMWGYPPVIKHDTWKSPINGCFIGKSSKYLCVYIYVYMYVCMHACMYVCIFVHISIYIICVWWHPPLNHGFWGIVDGLHIPFFPGKGKPPTQGWKILALSSPGRLHLETARNHAMK